MAELPFMPLATDAYLADCAHLSDAEHGRYLLLMIALWRAPGQRLPNDDEWLARKFGRSVERIKDEIRPLIKEFCKSTGNWITQKRLAKEFEYVTASRKKQSARAKSRWNKENNASRGNAAPQPSGNALNSTQLNSTKIEDKDSVAKATGGTPPEIDPVKILFDDGVSLLVENGCKSTNARSIIGKWRKEHGDETTQAAIKSARAEGVTEPIAWITQRFAGKPRESWDQRRIREAREAIQ